MKPDRALKTIPSESVFSPCVSGAKYSTSGRKFDLGTKAPTGRQEKSQAHLQCTVRSSIIMAHLERQQMIRSKYSAVILFRLIGTTRLREPPARMVEHVLPATFRSLCCIYLVKFSSCLQPQNSQVQQGALPFLSSTYRGSQNKTTPPHKTMNMSRSFSTFFSLLVLLPLSICMPASDTPRSACTTKVEPTYLNTLPTPPYESTMSTVITTPATPSPIPLNLLDGRCFRKWYNHGLNWSDWQCNRKGFVCEATEGAANNDDVGGVCVDRRSPAEVELDRQEAADGKDGRCSFRFEDGYFCQRRGYVCVDGRRCEDQRTDAQKLEDGHGPVIIFLGYVLECLGGLFVIGCIGGICTEILSKRSSTTAQGTQNGDTEAGHEERSEEHIELLDSGDRAEDTTDASNEADDVPTEQVVPEEDLPGYTERCSKSQA